LLHVLFPHPMSRIPRPATGYTWYTMKLYDKKSKDKVQPPPPACDKKFRVGDLAVYPAHGVGRIDAIECKVVNGEKHDFYIMKILENGMVIMIPTWNVHSVGLRELIQENEIPKIYDLMRSQRDIAGESQTWNRRYRDYMEKIKTGSLFDVAEVFRDLYLLKLTKDLSFGERKLYDTAQTLLIKELSTSRQTTENTILLEIESLFIQETAEVQ
jgi:CarD family transcriptional regulator